MDIDKRNPKRERIHTSFARPPLGALGLTLPWASALVVRNLPRMTVGTRAERLAATAVRASQKICLSRNPAMRTSHPPISATTSVTM
jgi:hypothetical protein